MSLRTIVNDGLGSLAALAISHGCECCNENDHVTDCYNRALTTSIANSSLRPPLRHPAKPIQRTRRGDVEDNVNPQEPEISPPVGKADADRLQKLRRRLDRAVLADSRGRRINNKAAGGTDVCR